MLRVAASPEIPPGPVAPAGLFCPACGYDLRHNASGICPECGQPFDPAALSVSVIPWEHRRLGRFRAFWRTAWVATVRVGRLRHEHARDLSFAAAQRFRWLCVLTAWLLPAVTLIFAAWAGSAVLNEGFGRIPAGFAFGALIGGGVGAPQTWGLAHDLAACAGAGVLIPGVAPVALLLCLLGFTGVSSYLFHPRSIPVERQNRAVALSAYLAAPLAWVPVGLAVFGLGSVLIWVDDDGSDLLLRVVAVAIAATGLAIAVPILQTYVHTLLLLRWSTGAGAARMWAAALLLPVLWLAIVVLTLIGIPAAAGLVAIMLASTFG